MRTWMAATGAAFILIGGVLAAVIVLTFPELPSTYCTDVGYRGDPPGGFEYYGYSGISMVYSPDGGVNRCDTPIVTYAIASVAIGCGVLGFERWVR